MQDDKAGKAYWDQVWIDHSIPLPVNPRLTNIDNYVNRRFHEFFSAIFSELDPHNMLLLEIGCAGSAWLPYFAQQFGFKIYGLDYSEIGCDQSRKILSGAHVPGEIVCSDFFSPPGSLLEKFNIVITFGVVEHFADTRSCIGALSRFLKPGGLMITIIPNMVGLVGIIQKIVNRPVYNIHIPLNDESLSKAHQQSGLEVVRDGYFLSTHFGVVNLNGLDHGTLDWKLKDKFLKVLLHISKLVWLYENSFGQFKPNRWLSPYITCLAQKTV